MLSASQLKFLTALQVKKYRQKYRKFTVEGTKMMAELLTQERITVTEVYALERWALENAVLLAPFYKIFNPVSEHDLKKISSLSTPNAVLAVAEMPECNPVFEPDSWVLFLDGIRDPGNLGTILRIADWFGFSAVLCSPDCVDAFSPKVVQASMGAILRVPVAEMAWADLQSRLPAGWPVVGAVLEGENAFASPLPSSGLLVIGSESTGMRPEPEACLTHRLTIPRAPASRAESLNASVATGILAALLCNGPQHSRKK